MKKILALSSSRAGNGGFLEKAALLIEDFLGTGTLNIGFIPFASVDRNYELFGNMVKEALSAFDYHITVIDEENAGNMLNTVDVIMVGGGNTFKLLHDLYRYGLVDKVRKLVIKGIPYIGWSAGANITGLTLGTTNDMPIIQPQSFSALRLLPIQINPHYLNQKVEGFHGETRDQRLEEFVKMNRDISVIGLPEGTALHLENGVLRYLGAIPGVHFKSGEQGGVARIEIIPGEDLSFLL